MSDSASDDESIDMIDDDLIEDIDDLENEIDEEEDEDEDDEIDEDEIELNKHIEEATDIKERILVDPNDRVTSNKMTDAEYTEVLSIRSTQIEKTSNVFTNVDGLIDPFEMAKKELHDRRCPLMISRNIGLSKVEHWNPNDMILPFGYNEY